MQGSSEEASWVTLSQTLRLNNYYIKSIGVDRQPKKHYPHLAHTAMFPKSEISFLTPASRSHTSCSWKISVSSCQCPYPLFTPAWSRKDCNISQAKVHIWTPQIYTPRCGVLILPTCNLAANQWSQIHPLSSHPFFLLSPGRLQKYCITRKPVGHSLFSKPWMYSTSRCWCWRVRQTAFSHSRKYRKKLHQQ